MHDAPLGIMRDERRGVALVDLQTRRDGFGCVVRASLDLRPRGHTPHQLVFGDVEQEDMVQALAALAQRLVHQRCLCRGAGETVEDRAGFRCRAVQLVLDHSQDDGVGHQLAFVVVLLELESQRRAILHRFPDEITGGDLGQPEPLGEDFPLRPLARARRPQDENEH